MPGRRSMVHDSRSKSELTCFEHSTLCGLLVILDDLIVLRSHLVADHEVLFQLRRVSDFLELLLRRCCLSLSLLHSELRGLFDPLRFCQSSGRTTLHLVSTKDPWSNI